METSSNYAVLVLEQPWWALDIDPEQTSVRHFLDGLSRLESLPIYYSTFFDSNSFGQALQYLLDARKIDDVKHLIVYVVVASQNMLNFSRFENAQSCSPHEAKRNARFWGAMHPSVDDDPAFRVAPYGPHLTKAAKIIAINARWTGVSSEILIRNRQCSTF